VSAWGWSQWTIAALIVLGIVQNVSEHGNARSPYNGPSSFLAGALMAWLLWCGGFWG
jgi:hypothetical protein